MRYIHATLCLAFAAPMLQAQPYYQRTFGGWMNDDAYTILGTDDGGFITGGSTGSFVTGNNVDDLYLTKFDRQGGLRWSKHYSCGTVCYALDMARARQGNMVVAGAKKPMQGIVFKIDSLGNTLWGHGNGMRKCISVAVTAEDHVYALGYSANTNSDLQLDKFNPQGLLLWTKLYGTSYADEAGSVSATKDGGAIIAGSSMVGGPQSDGLLMRVDANGAVLWSRTYGLAGECEAFYNVDTIATGGYIAVGGGCGSNTWPLVVRVNNIGDTLWTRRFDYNGGRFRSVQSVEDGFIVGGDLSGAFTIPVLLKLDDNGNIVWQRVFTSWEMMAGTEVEHAGLLDGSLALISSTLNTGPGSRDHYVAVVDAHGQGSACGVDAGTLSTLPTVWQLGVQGEHLGPGSVTDLFPVAYTAATLVNDLCFSTGIGDEAQSTVDVIIDAAGAIATVRGLRPGQLVALHNAIGQELGAWRTQDVSLDVPLANTANGPLLLSVRDERGANVFARRLVVLHR